MKIWFTVCVRNLASGLLQIGHKWEKRQWRYNFPKWRHRQIFWRCFVSFVKFNYWPMFNVNIITGSGVMTIFFYKGLTRNLEIGNTPVWVLPNIWRLERVRDTKFGTNVSRMLQNIRVTAFTFNSLFLQGGKITPSPTQIRVNKLHFNLHDQRLWHKRKQKKNRKQKF